MWSGIDFCRTAKAPRLQKSDLEHGGFGRSGGLAHLYVFCKGGNHEVGCHSFLSRQSELCFQRRGRSANQSVSRGQNKNPDASCINPRLYKERGWPTFGVLAKVGTHAAPCRDLGLGVAAPIERAE